MFWIWGDAFFGTPGTKSQPPTLPRTGQKNLGHTKQTKQTNKTHAQSHMLVLLRTTKMIIIHTLGFLAHSLKILRIYSWDCDTSINNWFTSETISLIFWSFQVAANNSFINWTNHGLATTISYLVLKLSSPRLPTTLTIICTSIIGKKYREEAVRLARLDKPSSPVLGEPLMSSRSILTRPSLSPISWQFFLVFWLRTFVIIREVLW